MRLLIALLVSILAVAIAPTAFCQGETSRSADVGPEQIDNIVKTASAFLIWIIQEKQRQPLLPGAQNQRIPQAALCAKANEVFSTLAVPEDDAAALVMHWKPNINGNIGDEKALSPYFIGRAIAIACNHGTLDIYDPREQTETLMIDGEPHSSQEGYPVCPGGPRIAVRLEDRLPLLAAIESFEKLERLAFVCIGAQAPQNTLTLTMMGMQVSAAEFLILNSKIGILALMDSKIGRLRIAGTIAAISADTGANFLGESDFVKDWQSAYPGTRIEFFTALKSEIKDFRITGAYVGLVNVADCEIESASLYRSDSRVVSISKSKFLSLSIWETRVATGFALTDNIVTKTLNLGANTEPFLSGAMLQSLQYGPEPPWVPQFPYSKIFVRGYMTLYQTRVDEKLTIYQLNFGPKGFLQDGNVGVADNKEIESGAIMLNRVSAKNVEIAGGIYRFGKQGNMSGEDIVVAESMIVRNVFLHRLNRDVVGSAAVNRGGADATQAEIEALVVLKGLRARKLAFEQNLFLGPLELIESAATTIFVGTARGDVPKVGNFFEFCIGPRQVRPDIVGVLPGGAKIGKLPPMPLAGIAYPPCYGSIILNRGAADDIVIDGLLSDVFVQGLEVKYGLAVGGRVSGVVNIANLQSKDGRLALGARYHPLLWCKSSRLLIDIVRIATLQADRDSFDLYDCDAPQPYLYGLLPLSLRYARIEQIIGHSRVEIRDQADAGLLGLSSHQLTEIVAPIQTTVGTTNQRPEFDPQSIALLSTKLREVGFISKANHLAMERVSRQKWDSERLVDRIKWFIGWPVGWGFKAEWGFIYAGIVILLGAWVSAYYRVYPAQSPPSQGWLREALVFDADMANRFQTVRLLTRRVFVFALCVGVSLGVLWLPIHLQMDQLDTLLFSAVTLSVLVLWLLRKLAHRDGWPDRLGRILNAGRYVGYHELFFSIDRFLPAPGLHSYWANYPRIGQAGRNYFYVHRLMGLVIVTITAAGAVGLFDT